MKLEDQQCSVSLAMTPLAAGDIQELLGQVPGWSLEDREIRRELVFDDFRAAMAFVNRVAELANEQDHHPDIHVEYNRVALDLATHKIGALSRNDFIMAARINVLAHGPTGKARGR